MPVLVGRRGCAGCRRRAGCRGGGGGGGALAGKLRGPPLRPGAASPP